MAAGKEIEIAGSHSPVVTGEKKHWNNFRRSPVVSKTAEGIKIEDRDGYYRIVKSYAEATPIVQDLLAHHNSVMSMNGFESAKWRNPKCA